MAYRVAIVDDSTKDAGFVQGILNSWAEQRQANIQAEGVPVIGYQHWSLMDNFEWAEGYDPRFGLVYVDFETGKRKIKKSGYHYKHIIETNGASL